MELKDFAKEMEGKSSEWLDGYGKGLSAAQRIYNPKDEEEREMNSVVGRAGHDENYEETI